MIKHTRLLPNIAARLVGQPLIDVLHAFWYRTPNTWQKNTYCGREIQQIASDMWLYQELIYREQPAFIVQTGVKYGGSILYFAHIMDAIGADPAAPVIGIDVALTPEAKSLNHPRIRLIEGSSTDPETVKKVKDLLPAPMGLVSLDSDHSCDHVLHELEIYHELAAIAGHLVVEDTNINGHPAYPSFGPGPFEAVTQFLKANHDFISDDALWRRNHFSFHQHGWLLRVK